MSQKNTNKLATETSLYLQQHAENPVNWYPWGSEAFKAAKAENKPILLSVGYAACHWCHVMAHESFEDVQTAELMNRFFVNVKVDREERPDVDALYQEALRLTGRQGGWPLTMFVTPEGRPFFGGTYFPAEMQGGAPNFREVLWQVANMWRKDPELVVENSKALEAGLKKLALSESGTQDVLQERIDELTQDILPLLDPDNGGFGRQDKFPNVTALQLMWQTWRCGKGEPQSRRLFAAGARLSLDSMCLGGLFDHVGGGFFRYTIEPSWLIPHFEKMLYDNAMLLDVLTQVWRETRNPLYENAIHETAAWLMNEMTTSSGAFAASVDADNAEGEGAYYIWSVAELKELLGDKAEAFMKAYGVTKEGNFEGKNILNRLHARHEKADIDFTAELEILQKARSRRPAPTRDEKVLTDWNGLAIASLAEAAMCFAQPAWLAAAEAAYGAVLEHSLDGNGTKLVHSWCGGKAQSVSYAEDYAGMIHAALTLFEATGNETYLKQSEMWALWLVEHYEDSTGGFFKSAKDNKDLFTPIKEGRDNAWPSANGLMVQNFARLYALSGNILWREQGRRVFGAFGTELKRYVFGYTSLLMGQSKLQNNMQLVLVGDATAEGFAEMQQAVWQAPQPNKAVLCVADTKNLGPLHPAYGKTMQDGKATLYVCENKTCGAAINSAEVVAQTLGRLSEATAPESSARTS